MRGVSAIIATVLVLMISVSLVSVGYVFFTEVSGEAAEIVGKTAEKSLSSIGADMTVESVSGRNIYVRNTGRTNLSAFSVYVNDFPASFSIDRETLQPGETATIALDSDPVGLIEVYSSQHGPAEFYVTTLTCPDGICDADENCPDDVSDCSDNACYEPTCTNGCGQVPVASGGTDEACNAGGGCASPPCYCDGSGNCVSTPPTCPDGICDAGENCPSDASSCPEPSVCFERTCVNGCNNPANPISSGQQDTDSSNLCDNTVGCASPPCQCDGSGNCVSGAPPVGLVGFWKFDGDATDSSGNGNDGTVSGATWTGGVSGQALDFDGLDDYVDLGTMDVSGDEMTLMAWFKADDFGVSDGRIISKAISQSEQGHWWMLSTIDSAGDMRLRFRLKTGTNPSSGTTTLIASSGNLNNEWVHAAAVYNGTHMILYKDGVQVGITPKTGSIATDNTVSAWIGDNPGPNRKQFDGTIDEVKIYDKALTPEDIQQEYQSYMVGYWKFDEGSGSTATDSSGNSNDGTLSPSCPNCPQWVAGQSGMALVFDGNDDYVIKNPFNIPQTEVTIAFWMRTSDTTKSGTPFSYAVIGSDNELLIYNYRNFDIFIKGASVNTGIAANDDSWHHIAVTWRSSDGEVIMYIDGSPSYSGTLRQGAAIAQGGSLVIGQEQDSVGGGFDNSQAFAGTIDEVQIWDRVLTQSEIQSNM